MKKSLFLTIFTCLLILSLSTRAQSRQEIAQYRYEIESYSEDVPKDLSVRYVRVWNYGSTVTNATANCMKNAIHGILFKGYAALSDRSVGLKPLVPEGYDAHKDYFDNFFGSAQFMQFVQLTNNGQPEPGGVVKAGRREYKVSMVVVISFEALRNRLEKDGIIKKLDFLF